MKGFWAVLVCLFFFGSGAEAATISSLYGDVDGFGLGYQAGETFKTDGAFRNSLQDNRSLTDAATVTDAFGHGKDNGQAAWRQWTMALTDEQIGDLGHLAATSISLEMLTGAAPRFYGDSRLYLDTDPGDAEKWMAVGRFFAPHGGGETLVVREDMFDLFPFQKWILPCLRSSGLSFKMMTPAAPSTDLSFEGWVMDYSTLTVAGERTAIPEAGTLWLLAGGLATLLMVRRRRAA